LLGLNQQQQPQLIDTFDMIDLNPISSGVKQKQISDFEMLSIPSSGGQAEESKVHQ